MIKGSPKQVLLIAPELLGESLSMQLNAEESDYEIVLNKEKLTKQPSLVIWSIESIEKQEILILELNRLKEKWKPLTTIFLYRRNIVEHFLSFLAYHRTGIGNATSQFMQYQRPREPFDDDWIKYYANHFWIMNKCYEDHNFDYTVAYEDLFNMD